VDDGTEVSRREAAVGARWARAGRTDVARMQVDLGRIIAAVKSTVPQEMWGEIADKLDRPELEPSVPFDEDGDDFEGEDEVFDPADFVEEDDEL